MFKKLKAWYLRVQNPNYSCCKRCGTPWNHCNERTVLVTKSVGQFSVCEECWKESTLQELIQYYSATYLKNEEDAKKFNYSQQYSLGQLVEAVKRDKEGRNNNTINNILENNA